MCISTNNEYWKNLKPGHMARVSLFAPFGFTLNALEVKGY